MLDTPAVAAAQGVIKVVIIPSRTSVSRDASYGVLADFENVSAAPVTVRSGETVLVVQPEVSKPNPCVDWAFGIFPTEPNLKPGSENLDAKVTILPKEHYKVFWDLSSGFGHHHGSCETQAYFGWLNNPLGFVPGEYVFTIEGIAASPGNTTPAADVRHTFTESTTLKVGISQVATAWAAFFGALLAYIVVGLQPGQDFDKWLPAGAKVSAKGPWVLLRNGLSAGLLGSAVTIVASRLSDTQFPVKVSVNDFWGALTIGFVAYFIGTKFIASLAARMLPGAANIPARGAEPGLAPAGPLAGGTPVVPAEPPAGKLIE